MKKILSVITACILLFALAACGSTTNEMPSSNAPANTPESTANSSESNPGNTADTEPSDLPSQSAEPEQQPSQPDHAKVLVVVFSATGTTKGVAERIAAIESADLYEIIPAEPYSDDDLNWQDSNSRATTEQNDRSVRPGIAGEALDLSGYEIIYIGYPIWWGEEPRIVDTFVESHDFTGITVIPFCTSSSSGIGRSGQNLAENAGSGNWLEGRRFPGSVSDPELQSWIGGLN